jgi:hypothetical protein
LGLQANTIAVSLSLDKAKLRRDVQRCVAAFYEKRITTLDSLDLKKVLKRKNPYLLRVSGISVGRELVSQLLYAYVSASEEGIFANTFFEPVFVSVAKGTRIAGTKGVDFVRQTTRKYEAVALKSGPNIFNSDQVSKQGERFAEMNRSLRATLRGTRREFVPIMGCCYGQCDLKPSAGKNFYKLAGQSFWQYFTGNDQFYLELVAAIGTPTAAHVRDYKKAWTRAVTRFTKEFAREFCESSGAIQWKKLTEFNSGKKPIRERKLKTARSSTVTEKKVKVR